MLDALRRLAVYLQTDANIHETDRNARKLAVLAVKNEKDLPEQFQGMAAMEAKHTAITSAWIPVEKIREGQGGAFDTNDLRHWIALAERAGVPAVPIREVLTISMEEMSVLSGKIALPEGPLSRKLAAVGQRLREQMGIEQMGIEQTEAKPDSGPDSDLIERLFAAMDDVPEGWMVRHVRCGPSNLKAIAGMGFGGPSAPSADFGPDLEVGPGWIRNGNRRRVDVSDTRITKAAVEGGDGPQTFVARPWVKSARWVAGEDPHRRNTPIQGNGVWPAEWRAFVENGKVIGISWYYGWTGEATPENAAIAIEVRETAQKIVDEALRLRAIPQDPGRELLRGTPRFADVDERFPIGSIACTLDFIETVSGLMLLEGGPAYSRIGGGHPCAFAGCDVPEGVAFRIMPGISLADPRTWKETDRTDCILSWDEVHDLARSGPHP